MSNESIVMETGEQIDAPTSHAIAAAQLRAEARTVGKGPQTIVRAIAAELEGLGLRPNLRELARRYRAGETKFPTWMRERRTAAR